MDKFQEAINEDLKAVAEAFRSDDFGDMNIYANRIMANAMFGNDATIFLPGFFLKDVATDFMLLKAKEQATAYSTAKSHGFKYVESLVKSFPSADPASLWKEFHEYSDIIRKFQMSSYEEKSYSKNVEFTKTAFSWLMAYLKEHKKVLSDPKNLLLSGILNELDRIFRSHSGELSEIALISMVEALERYYAYVRRIYRTMQGKLEEGNLSEIFDYVDKMHEIYSHEMKIEDVNEILWKLVKGWREFYVQYMELSPPRIEFEKGIELPPELKKKMTESVSETLEKKM